MFLYFGTDIAKISTAVGWGFWCFTVFSKNRLIFKTLNYYSQLEKHTKNLQKINGILSLQLRILPWKFNSSQVKWMFISSIVNSVYELGQNSISKPISSNSSPNFSKVDIKVSSLVPMCLIFWLLTKHFVTDCL